MDNNELCHFGIKGQKWGVRRYQNPDGTLTEEGKRRQAKQEARQQTKQAKAEARIAKKNRRKYNLSGLSDDELSKRTARINAEKNYISAQMELNKLNPKHKSLGQKFIESVWGNMVKPALEDTGKRWVAKQLRAAMNVRTKDDVKYDQANLNKNSGNKGDDKDDD